MTANFEEKKREKRNRDKENLILLRVDRRIEKRKKKEKGESLERERYFRAGVVRFVTFVH